MDYEANLWNAQGEPRVQIQVVLYPKFDWPYGSAMPFLKEQGRLMIVVNGEYEDVPKEWSGIRIEFLGRNLGYSAAHNYAIRQAPVSIEYILTLNPDVLLTDDYIPRLVNWLDKDSDCGMVTGKLLRFDGMTIDSTGISFLKSMRWVDRGQGQLDKGQFDTPDNREVSGVSGAAAIYRRKMLSEIADMDGQFFDEDLFLYKEDVDLSWRARRFGWSAKYISEAVAYHDRSWNNNRSRKTVSASIRRRSLRNHYLIMIKNVEWVDIRHNLINWFWWEFWQAMYILVREPTISGGYIDAWRLFRRFLIKRKWIHNRLSSYSMRGTFQGHDN
ncbi:putative Glycosyl transferase, family 2 [Sulfobacillus acidophilus TPY]|uniref:Glycosyl transferase family 2 n=1 Tax=Sulfobacillus acidophilus (strain ATCC 700253 / DSM 10332 / NAL) TaxID=679936 RepID=G8TU40_SULAD|nr:putative Glycosyl transferase, family 2 [Sulfobacillus acidophilus TPY]AEW05712.1 glycosyl transferase family 2 [Sulfobacillus acidophilus DSM 10332]